MCLLTGPWSRLTFDSLVLHQLTRQIDYVIVYLDAGCRREKTRPEIFPHRLDLLAGSLGRFLALVDCHPDTMPVRAPGAVDVYNPD